MTSCQARANLIEKNKERVRVLKRLVSEILFALLLASMFTAAFNIQSIDVNARLQESVQIESVERAPSISWRNTVLLQQSNVATGQMPLKFHFAFMRPAVRDGGFVDLDIPPPANYDEQLGLTFTQSFTSIVYNVTAVQQVDSYGYGPVYLLNGVTDKGYWYQVGLSYDWPYTSGGYVAGWHFNYEVFDNTGKSIFPTNGEGGLSSFNGQVNSGDNVLLNLYFSGGNVVMYAYDWSTGASATVTYTAVGGSHFQGQTSAPSNANGFFTGLMTEWYHPNPYYGGEAQVAYNDTTFALSSGWLWADEWVPSNGTTLFSKGQYTSFSNPTQLQYFSTNGAFEAASGYLFITGTHALPSTTVFLTPYRIDGTAGQTVTVYANITDVTGLLAYHIGLIWSNTTVVECISVTGGSILNSIAGNFFEIEGTINNTLGKISSPYGWAGLGSYSMNGSGTLAVFTFKMLQTGYADIHVNNMRLIYNDGVTIIPCNIVDYFTAVRGGKQYVVRIEGNPVEASLNYGGFGAESVTELNPPKSINGTTYQGNMTFDINGTADGVGPFAYFNTTIPNNLMNCTSKDNWVVELGGVPQSGVLVSSGTQNTTISLTFSYHNASSGELTQTIEIFSNYIAAPAFSVTISPSSATLDIAQSQLFTSSVSGGTSPFSYQWCLNDAAVSGATSYTWAFNTSSTGSYTVYVKVTDAASFVETSNTATVTVNPALSVSVSPPSVVMDVGQSQVFTSSVLGGTSPYSYQWYLDGSVVSGATSATWTYMSSSAGSHTVYVKVTDTASATVMCNTTTLTVNPAPYVSISPTSITLDVGQSKTFNSTVSGGTSPFSYQWYLNGVAQGTGSSWTFTPNSSGSYSVYVNVTDDVGVEVESNVATVTVNTTLSVSISPPSVVMDVGQSQVFTSSVLGGTSPYAYEWFLNGTAVSGATSSSWTFTPSSSGSYSVYLNVTDNVSFKAKSNITAVTVNPAPFVSVSPTSVTLDVGQSQTFTSTVTGGTATYSYQWYLDGVAVSGATIASWTYTLSAAGSHTVYVRVTDSASTSVTAQSNNASVTVNPRLSVTISSPTATTDMGLTVSLNASASGGTQPYLYKWYVNGNPVSGAISDSFAFSPTSQGTYNIYATVQDNSGSKATSNTITMTVNPALVATVSFSRGTVDVGQNVQFTSTVNAGTPTYSYQWYLNGNTIQGATSAGYTFTPSSAGVYNISLVVQDAASQVLFLNPTEITVNSALVVSISGSASVTDVDRYVVFTASDTGGTEPISLQWYVNGTAVTGATSPAFTYVPTSSGTSDIYVMATDSVGFNVTSLSNEIRVNNSTLITNFSVPPLSSSMLFSNNEVNASVSIFGGSGPYTYKWYLNGLNVGNTTSPTYTYVFSKMGQQQMQVKITDSAGYVVESSVLSTNYSYNYVPFVVLAVLIIAVIGELAFILHRRASKRAARARATARKSENSMWKRKIQNACLLRLYSLTRRLTFWFMKYFFVLS